MHTAIYSIYNPSGPPATEQGSAVHRIEEYSMINQLMNRATSQNCFHNKTKENAFEWMQLKAKSVPLPPIIIPWSSQHTSCDVGVFQRYGAYFVKELSVTNQEICGQSVKALLGIWQCPTYFALLHRGPAARRESGRTIVDGGGVG